MGGSNVTIFSPCKNIATSHGGLIHGQIDDDMFWKKRQLSFHQRRYSFYKRLGLLINLVGNLVATGDCRQFIKYRGPLNGSRVATIRFRQASQTRYEPCAKAKAR